MRAIYTVYTAPDDVASVAEALTNDGYELLSAQAEMVPQNTIKLTDEGDIKTSRRCSICSRTMMTSRTCGTTGKSDLPVKRMRFRTQNSIFDG